MPKKSLMYVYFALFTLSGFSGLIYQSVWSHYLKLFLGHAAYAQTLVLIIFMGGMAIGAYIAAKHSVKAKNLILLYAIAEGIVGLFGVFFHQMFTGVTEFAFTSVIPGLDSSFSINTAKWLIAAMMIMPQSILLGATFPLLATGIIRKFGSEGGKHLATLYFTNSLGAAVGVIANIYYFIPAAGLPGSAVIAGTFNLCIALAIWLFSRSDVYPYIEKAKESVGKANIGVFLLVAGVTGAASFIYEIIWIRMLSMVLGASTHAFEIMLSAFILGLAIGSFWIRKRINKFKSPTLALGVIQIVMGVFALLTLPLYDKSFELMLFFSNSLALTDNGYILFNIVSYLICVFVMLPTTICAGMTLPLLTHLLIKSTGNDNSVGKIYTANTIGAIIGIVLASQILMPLMGMKNALVVGASLDLAVGFYLFFVVAGERQTWQKIVMVLPIGLAAFITVFVSLDPMKMSSSVFRSGRYLNPYLSEVVYYEDGKTSTVTMTKVASPDGMILSIINNGKPDAAIRYKMPDVELKPTTDEPTMILLGSLPYLLSDKVKVAANIGLGSGLTAQTLLQNPNLQRLDSIEIEAAVVEGAKRFGERVDKVYSDPRSNIIIDDAKTYFVSNKTQYDAIISEPPNPWVSGVSSLFGVEFYELVKQYLNEDGVFVQWMHLYELNPRLLQSIYKALRLNFDHVQIYQISDVDIALIASINPIKAPRPEAFAITELNDYLNYIGVFNVQDIYARKLGGQQVLDDYLLTEAVKENSDYFPSLDFGAIKARFLKQDAKALFQLHHGAIHQRLHDHRKFSQSPKRLSQDGEFPYAFKFNDSQQFYEMYQQLLNGEAITQNYNYGIHSRAHQLYQLVSHCQLPDSNPSYNTDLVKLLSVTEFAWLSLAQLRDIYQTLSDQCLQHLSVQGQYVVNTVLGWLNDDIESVNLNTLAYLQQRPALQTAADLQMMKFYAYGVLKSGAKGQYDFLYNKLSARLKHDVELKMFDNRYLDEFYPTEMDRFMRMFSMSQPAQTPVSTDTAVQGQ